MEPAGNGGIVSPIGDMYKWHVALLGDAVLSAEAKRKAFTPHIREGEGADSFYGYGWALFKTPRGTNLIAHNGGDGVSAADFLRFVDEGVVVYGASNVSDILAWQVTPKFAEIVFGGDVVVPPAVTDLSVAALGRAAGTYVLRSGDELQLAVEDGHLLATPVGQGVADLLWPRRSDTVARFAELNRRTKQIVEQSRRGELEPLRQAFGGQVGPKFFERQQETQRDQEQRLGAFKSVTRAQYHCGTRGPRVHSRAAQFERGGQLVE